MLSASELVIHLAQTQIELLHHGTDDAQGKPQETPFRLLEKKLGVLGSRFALTPTVSQEYRRTRIRGGCTTLGRGRHTTDHKHLLVDVIHKGLRLRLIKLLRHNIHIGIHALRRLHDDRTEFLELFDTRIVNLTVLELQEALNELLNTIHSVAHDGVDRIQQRNGGFKRTHPRHVQPILENRNIAQTVRFPLFQYTIFDLEVMVTSVAAIGSFQALIGLFFVDLTNTHHPALTETCVVHHEGVARVRGIKHERSVILGCVLTGKNHAIANTANRHPCSDFLVTARLVLEEHEVIQRGNLVGRLSTLTAPHIGQRFTEEISARELRNLSGMVFNDLVANLRPHLFRAGENRLIALHVAIEVVNLKGVGLMNEQRLTQHIAHIIACDFFNGGDDLRPAKKRILDLNPYVLTHLNYLPSRK